MSPEERSIREKVGEPGKPLVDQESEIARLRHENEDLRMVIEELLRRLYGKRSEKTNRPKPPAASADKSPSGAKNPRPPKPGHGRSQFPPELPRETTVTDVPEADRKCDICGTPLIHMGEDTSERGHIPTPRVIILRYVANKYGCPHGHMVKTSEGAPAGLVDRAKWSTESYASIVVDKFGDYQPFERIHGQLLRQGVDLPTSTMADMAETVGDRVAPILDQGKKEILAETHLQADETPIDVMVQGEKGSRQGFLWAWRAGKKLLFEFDFSRGGNIPKRFLGSWAGTLQTDGYQGYDAVVAANRIKHAGCWTHARRKWKDAADLGSKEAEAMLRVMGRLWWIEGAVKTRASARKLSPDEAEPLLARVRDERSRKVVDRVRALLDPLIGRPEITRKSPLAKAVTYLKNQWQRLLLFLHDPKLEIDTNGLEREMRSVAMGKKNWYVAGSPKGAVTAARLYSVINTCKALRIDPQAYLTDVLEKVSPHADLSALTPWAWAESRARPPAKGT